MSPLVTACITLLTCSLVSTQGLNKPPPQGLSQDPPNSTDTDITPSLLLTPTTNNDTDPLSSLQWTPAPNTTATTSGTPSNLVYSCNGRMYGSNLRYQSCIDALEQIKLTDKTIHTYGYRNGRDMWDFNVPQRWISSMHFPQEDHFLSCFSVVF